MGRSSEFHEAIVNLRKSGASYSQIAKKLGVSKGAISYWLHNLDWSKSIEQQLRERANAIGKARLERLIASRKQKLDALYERAKQEAIVEYANFKREPLFIAGLGVYWGEGDKSIANGQLRVGNVDYRLLNTFKFFLQKYFNVPGDKIRGWLLLYPDLDPVTTLKFWSEKVMLSPPQFCKPIAILGRHKKRRLEHGVCALYVSSKFLKTKLLAWLELFAEEMGTLMRV